MMKSVLTFLATSLVLAVLLSACATPTLQPGEDKTAPMKITIEEINSFEDEIEKARQEQLDILSPNWFVKAEASFGEAKTKAEKGTDLMDIREDMSDARTYLANAEDTAKVARTMLPEVIESRRLARVAGATELEKEYGQVEGEFLKLTEAIEKNNIKYTKKNAPKVNEAFLDLELMAMYRLGYLPEDKRRPTIDWSSRQRKRLSQYVFRNTCSTPEPDAKEEPSGNGVAGEEASPVER